MRVQVRTHMTHDTYPSGKWYFSTDNGTLEVQGDNGERQALYNRDQWLSVCYLADPPGTEAP